MTLTKGRLVVCNEQLIPKLPGLIVEIDGDLYIDIDSAGQSRKMFRTRPGPLNYLLPLHWMWLYDHFPVDLKRYYVPSRKTVLVEWGASYCVSRALNITPAWKEEADEVFTELRKETGQGPEGGFAVGYGTHSILAIAYNVSNYFEGIGKTDYTADEILSMKLAETDVVQMTIRSWPLRYRLEYYLIGFYYEAAKWFAGFTRFTRFTRLRFKQN